MALVNYKHFISTVDLSSLPSIGFDTHAHVCSHYFQNDVQHVLSRANEHAVSAFLSICLTLKAYLENRALYDNPSIDIYTAIGIHPCDVNKDIVDYREQFPLLLASDPRIKAIGETGLDYHWEDGNKEQQKESFIEHIVLAKEYDKTLVLHTRKAEEDVYNILCSEAMEGHRVIWHCYGGSASLAEKIAMHGWYISFAGNVTYPSATNIREALHVVPLEQLLIETDCPYLSPQPQRGQRNEPKNIIYTAEVIAYELGIDIQTIWKQTAENAKKVLAIE